jgi:hypothetical protein
MEPEMRNLPRPGALHGRQLLDLQGLSSDLGGVQTWFYGTTSDGIERGGLNKPDSHFKAVLKSNGYDTADLMAARFVWRQPLPNRHGVMSWEIVLTITRKRTELTIKRERHQGRKELFQQAGDLADQITEYLAATPGRFKLSVNSDTDLRRLSREHPRAVKRAGIWVRADVPRVAATAAISAAVSSAVTAAILKWSA